MRRALAILAMVSAVGAAGATAALAGQGPPRGGCPPSGGWTLRDASEPGAAPIDLNVDGWICGKKMSIPAHPGLDNYIDNVVPL